LYIELSIDAENLRKQHWVAPRGKSPLPEVNLGDLRQSGVCSSVFQDTLTASNFIEDTNAASNFITPDTITASNFVQDTITASNFITPDTLTAFNCVQDTLMVP
jgi:hypothetical protein